VGRRFLAHLARSARQAADASESRFLIASQKCGGKKYREMQSYEHRAKVSSSFETPAPISGLPEIGI
jgi:hypothetical protein